MKLDKLTLDRQAGQLRRSTYWGQHRAWDEHEKYIDALHGIIYDLVDEVKILQARLIELESKTAHLPSHVDIETH